ncbi:hypothetical protein RJ639_012956, partial [Escallonia herrerae]
FSASSLSSEAQKRGVGQRNSYSSVFYGDVDMDEDVEGNSRLVYVRFVTKLDDPFKVPDTQLGLPSNITRLGLSTVVNNVLQSGPSFYSARLLPFDVLRVPVIDFRRDNWRHEPFDFLINGELVRMSLEEFLLAKGISAEKVLEIEYIKAVAPRKQEEPSFHDDWVSAVDGSNPGFILTGCYDALGRVWKAAGLYVENDTGALVATASKDKTLRLWMFDAEESRGDPTKIRAYKTLRGHNASVQSIAAQPSGDMVCSGSWDCRINLWQTKESDAGASVSIKKRKKGSHDGESQSEGEPVSTLVGHTQCVSSVVWPQHGTIYSASWDHSIRRWDAETGNESLNTCCSDSSSSLDPIDSAVLIFCGKVINCIDIGGESSALIAAGGSDPILRIWDPRKPGSSAPIFQFSSHASWISACKWHKDSWFHLLSASYDGKIMLWDLRTAWPLAVIDSHEDKVLCADWWKGDSVISGGVDSKLCISSEISVK